MKNQTKDRDTQKQRLIENLKDVLGPYHLEALQTGLQEAGIKRSKVTIWKVVESWNTGHKTWPYIQAIVGKKLEARKASVEFEQMLLGAA